MTGRWLLCVFLFAGIQGAIAQDGFGDQQQTRDLEESSDDNVPAHVLVSPEDMETTRTYRSEVLEVREFDEEKWKEITSGVDYSEAEPVVAPKTIRGPSKGIWDSPLLAVIFYVIVVVVGLVVLYFIFKNIVFDVKRRRKTGAPEDTDTPVEDVRSFDARALLDAAIRDGNLKLAVRLYYLSVLQQLHARGLITWTKDKTNRDYLNELFSRNTFFEEMRRLTLSYESAWYGDHDVRPESFQTLSAQFEAVLNRIANGAKP